MTLPNVVKDLFILTPSFSRTPVLFVLLIRSLPAKSTNEILDSFCVVIFVSLSIYFCVNLIVNTA